MENKINIVGLCAGRHNLPVSNYIFDEINDPTDFAGMRKTAAQWVDAHCDLHRSFGAGLNQLDYTDVAVCVGTPLTIYVTGLTAALTAVLSVCAQCGISVTLMHYDRDTGEYLPQQVL